MIVGLMSDSSIPSPASWAAAFIGEAAKVNGVTLIGFDYVSKSTGETARHTVRIGQSYENALKSDLALLEGLAGTLTGIDEDARAAVAASVTKSLAALAIGEQSEDFTKRGKYATLCAGVQVFEDGTLEIKGFSHAKRVLVEGPPQKAVNSRPLTIAKRKLEKLLKKSKFRTFSLDAANCLALRINGREFGTRQTAAA